MKAIILVDKAETYLDDYQLKIYKLFYKLKREGYDEMVIVENSEYSILMANLVIGIGGSKCQ